MAEMDSGTACNDLLERANKTSAQVVALEARIKVLEDRAIREDRNAEFESMGKKLDR
jgi:hypothetical protein